ncbi:MAG: phosphotransferase family protein [Actinomycetota bacterium]
MADATEPLPVDPFADDAPPETAPVRPGEDLDWVGIEAHLRDHLPADVDTSGPFRVEQFPNGSANLTYLIAFGPTELVLRRPPFGTLAPGAHDMQREFRVLSRLWEHFDRAPRAYLLLDDPTIAGADAFVMERRRGEVVRGVIPPSMRGHERVGHRLGLALVDAIAEFHLLDPEACGLGGLGRPDGFMERQVRGWHKRWTLVADPEWDAAMTDLHGRLAAAIPPPQRVSLIHNDLKLDNCLFDEGDPDRVTAFFDWDMTTLGDPLCDLGTLLNYWPDPGDDGSRRTGHDGLGRMGLPSRAEITDRYGRRTGLDVSLAPWYDAFAQWKTAVVVRQLHHRWLVGDSTDERMATIAEQLPALAATADGLLTSIDR